MVRKLYKSKAQIVIDFFEFEIIFEVIALSFKTYCRDLDQNQAPFLIFQDKNLLQKYSTFCD